MDEFKLILLNLGSEDLFIKREAEQRYIEMLGSPDSITLFLQFFDNPKDKFIYLLLKELDKYIFNFWDQWTDEIKTETFKKLFFAVNTLISHQEIDFILPYSDLIHTVFYKNREFPNSPFYSLLIIFKNKRISFSNNIVAPFLRCACNFLSVSHKTRPVNTLFWLKIIQKTLKENNDDQDLVEEIMAFIINKIDEILENNQLDQNLRRLTVETMESAKKCILNEEQTEAFVAIINKLSNLDFTLGEILQASQGLTDYIIQKQDESLLIFYIEIAFEALKNYIEFNIESIQDLIKYISRIPQMFITLGKSYKDIHDLVSRGWDESDIISCVAVQMILVISSIRFPIGEDEERDIVEKFNLIFESLEGSPAIGLICDMLQLTLYGDFPLYIVYTEMLIPTLTRLIEDQSGQYDSLSEYLSTIIISNPSLVNESYLSALIESGISERSFDDYVIILVGFVRSLPSNDEIFQLLEQTIQTCIEADKFDSLVVLLVTTMNLFPGSAEEIYLQGHQYLIDSVTPQQVQLSDGSIYEDLPNVIWSIFIFKSFEQLIKTSITPLPILIKDLIELLIPNVYRIALEHPLEKIAKKLKILIEYFDIDFSFDMNEIDSLRSSNAETYFDYAKVFSHIQYPQVDLSQIESNGEKARKALNFIKLSVDAEHSQEAAEFAFRNAEIDISFKLLKKIGKFGPNSFLDDFVIGFLQSDELNLEKYNEEFFLFLDTAFKHMSITAESLTTYVNYVIQKCFEDESLAPILSDSVSLVGFHSPEHLEEFNEVISFLLERRDYFNTQTKFLLFLALAGVYPIEDWLIAEALSMDINDTYNDYSLTLDRIIELTASENKELTVLAIQFLTKLLASSSNDNGAKAPIEKWIEVSQRLNELFRDPEIQQIVVNTAESISGGFKALFCINFPFGEL